MLVTHAETAASSLNILFSFSCILTWSTESCFWSFGIMATWKIYRNLEEDVGRHYIKYFILAFFAVKLGRYGDRFDKPYFFLETAEFVHEIWICPRYVFLTYDEVPLATCHIIPPSSPSPCSHPWWSDLYASVRSGWLSWMSGCPVRVADLLSIHPCEVLLRCTVIGPNPHTVKNVLILLVNVRLDECLGFCIFK